VAVDTFAASPGDVPERHGTPQRVSRWRVEPRSIVVLAGQSGMGR
jgi:hypothetical protein